MCTKFPHLIWQQLKILPFYIHIFPKLRELILKYEYFILKSYYICIYKNINIKTLCI